MKQMAFACFFGGILLVFISINLYNNAYSETNMASPTDGYNYKYETGRYVKVINKC